MTLASGKEKLNKNCPGVKRLMREAAELSTPTEHYYAAPLDDNLFEWHFTVRGQEGTSFERGIYHGRIIFPVEYPLKPPAVILLTPNGRFEINKKICLSISEHHPETWQPSWSIRTVLLAIIGFMPTPGKGAIGALDWTDEERRKLALASLHWGCKGCGVHNTETLLPVTRQGVVKDETDKYASELSFSAEKAPVNDSEKDPINGADNQSPGDTQPNHIVGEASDSPNIPHAHHTHQPAHSNPAEASQPTTRSPQPPAPIHQPTGGFCSLFIMYLLAGLISALFLRRFVRGLYQEFSQPDFV